MKKKKIVKKRIAKKAKVIKRVKPVVQQQSAMAIIPYSEITKPETHQGKFALVPTLFNQTQIQAILAPTPREIVKSRPGKGGGKWDYVPGWWFKKKANFVFGFSHDFEIVGERVDGNFITVKGKLTVRNPKTGDLVASKMDYGSSEIKMKKSGGPLDIGNDFKAASTDAFKRCMVQFGFAMDVYGKNEVRDEGMDVTGDPNDPENTPKPNTPAAQEQVGLWGDEVAQIIKIAKEIGATNEKQVFVAVRKIAGYSITDWKMTHGAIKDILSKMLQFKLKGGRAQKNGK
jgi:hypothetical protein